MKQVYPIILTPAEEGGYVVNSPDLNVCTEGETVPECIEMARDAIGLWGICEEDSGHKIPAPATLNLDHAPDEIVTLVDIDFAEYRRSIDNRAVRKNVTLPSRLNYLAEQAGINFSQVLQEGLKAKLHIQE